MKPALIHVRKRTGWLFRSKYGVFSGAKLFFPAFLFESVAWACFQINTDLDHYSDGQKAD
jgi:hypothetical protein